MCNDCQSYKKTKKYIERNRNLACAVGLKPVGRFETKDEETKIIQSNKIEHIKKDMYLVYYIINVIAISFLFMIALTIFSLISLL